MVWLMYRLSASTPGLAASRDWTVRLCCWASLKKESPVWIWVVVVAEWQWGIRGVRRRRRRRRGAAGALVMGKELRMVMGVQGWGVERKRMKRVV